MTEEFPFPRSAVALALLAVVVGRGLGQALPGSLTGIDTMISTVDTAAALLTQLGATLLTAQAVRGALVLVFTQHGHPVWKFVFGATTLLIAVTTLFAALLSHNQIAPSWSVLSALAVLGTLGVSGALALKDPERRGLGLITLGVALTGALHTGARVVALLAAERASGAGFDVARGVATLAFSLECICLGAAFVWLLRPQALPVKAAMGVALVLSIALALFALRPEGWGFVVGRTLEQLSAHPDPLLPNLVRYTFELWGLAAALGCLALPKRAPQLLLVLGLCILGRSSADVPLGAVFLLNGALGLQLGRSPEVRAPSAVPAT
jgi:hypothetical protein